MLEAMNKWQVERQEFKVILEAPDQTDPAEQ